MKLARSTAYLASLTILGACSDAAPATTDTMTPGTAGQPATAVAGMTSTISSMGGTTTNVPPATGGTSVVAMAGQPATQGVAGMSAATGGMTAMASMGGMPAAGGMASGGAAMAPFEKPSDFTCNMVVGLLITGEWYEGGNFEQKLEQAGGDPDKWQLKNRHYGNINIWADPMSDIWDEPVKHNCAQLSDDPDHIIFTGVSWEFTTEEQWVDALQAVVDNLVAKYPGVKWIDLASFVRCPDNMQCNANAVLEPGADGDAGRQDCYVHPFQDSAMEKVAAANPTLVGLWPQFDAPACRQPIDGAHLGGDGNNAAAQDIADYAFANP